MTSQASVNSLSTLARSSFRLAVTTALSALIVAAALLYGWYELRRADDQLRLKRSEAAKLLDQQNVLITQQQQLRRENAELIEAASAPLARVVKPRLSSHRLDAKSEDGNPLYDFVLYVDVPSNRRDDILDVEYINNHPKRLEHVSVGRNPGNGFAVSYRGDGCFSPVLVRVIPKSGDPFVIPFDMCRAWPTALAEDSRNRPG